MSKSQFLNLLFEKHQIKRNLPNPFLGEQFIESLLSFLFPAYSNNKYESKSQFTKDYDKIILQLEVLLLHVEKELNSDIKIISTSFSNELENLYQKLLEDANTIEKGDPAAKSTEEVIRTYPGFYAICLYRIANHMTKLDIPFVPRIISELAHSKTGIDIHPKATIGNNFFIDHGTGIVIGETSIIGNNVKIYQGVTLGALSVKKEMAETKRHPTIKDNVVIYAGATILGGNTIIGENSTIGGNVWLTESVEKNSIVYHKTQTLIKKNKKNG